MPGDQTLSPPLLGAIIANMLIDLMLPQTRVSQLHCYRTMCMNISILLGVVQMKVTRSRQNSEKYTLLGFNKFIRGYRISHQSKGHNATFSYQWLIVTSAVSRTVSELRRLICKYRLWDISVFHLPPFVSGNYVPFEYIHELCTPKNQIHCASRQWKRDHPTFISFYPNVTTLRSGLCCRNSVCRLSVCRL